MPRKTKKQKMRAHHKHIQVRPPAPMTGSLIDVSYLDNIHYPDWRGRAIIDKDTGIGFTLFANNRVTLEWSDEFNSWINAEPSCSCFNGIDWIPTQCMIHADRYRHVDIPEENFGKITYIVDPLHPQQKCKAYINTKTLEGNDKYSEEYVRVEWRDEFDCWVKIN